MLRDFTVILIKETHCRNIESSRTQLYKVNISFFVTTVMYAGNHPRI